MPNAGPFSMHFSAQRLADFCRQVRGRARSPTDSLQQLTVLQTFIGLAVDDPGQPGFSDAREYLAALLDELREGLFDRHAQELHAAIEERDMHRIARSFCTLSRSGFDVAASRAWSAVDGDLHDGCRAWIAQTFQDMRQRADSASRYPDAPDFRAAGVDLETYLALTALRDVVASDE